MPVVRFVALAALVVWLTSALPIVAGDWLRSVERVTYVCGAVMLVGLFVMKFVGPPPHAFPIRLTLVALILALTAAGHFWDRSIAATTISVIVGFVLLSWYARE
jgi:hypothetical protein